MTRPEGSPAKKRRWWLWWIAAPFGLASVAMIVAAIVWGHQVDRRLSKAIAAADRDDPNWRLDDLLAHRTPLPDAENSATIVAQVLELIPGNWPAAPPAPPGYPNPPKTAAWIATDRMIATAPNVRLDPDAERELRASLAEVSEAVRIARTVAGYPRGRHELTLGRTLLDTSLVETQAARGVARLLQADAALRAHDGHLDGALDSCRAILNVGRSIGDEPTIISQLVRIAISGTALTSARRVLAQGEPSDKALEQLQALIDDERVQPLTITAMRGERAGFDDLIRKLGTGEVSLSDLSEGGAGNDPARPRANVSAWGSTYFANNRAVMLEWMTDAVAICRLPDFEQTAAWARWDSRVQSTNKDWFTKFTTVLPSLLAPATSAVATAQARHRAELGSMSLLLADERFRRKAGRWPTSTEDLPASLLPHPPIDPFDGKPIRVVHRDGQLLVYSVGLNRKDDRGAYNPRQWTTGPFDVGTGAWDVSLRRQAAPLPDWPANVFQTIPEEGEKAP